MIDLNNDENSTLIREISLAWSNLSYEINGWFSREKKSILKRLNGYVQYGSLNAFLGPSGAGKTTLLNCLNGTLRDGITVDSEIYVNRFEENKNPIIRFVEQHVHETIITRMTIRETLQYAFRFKNPMSKWNLMEQHICSVLDELLLDQNILDNRFINCSGGEQRRIAIAQELMTLEKPTFLYIDEPTTGLDSNAAYLVIKCLRKLLHNSRLTILVSIHTPNSDTLALFDKIFVLAKGGVCIYSGTPNNLWNNLKDKINEEIDLEKPPIEEYLDIACEPIGSENVRKMNDSTLMEQHEKLDSIVDNLRFLENGIQQTRKRFNFIDFLLQLYRIMKITFISEYQNFLILFPFFFITLNIISTFFTNKITHANSCYSLEYGQNSFNVSCREKLYEDALVHDYRLHHYFEIMIVSVTIICTNTIFFHPILKIFRNEHRNQWYSLGTFYWSFMITSFIQLTIISVFIVIVSYFSVDHIYIDNYHLNWKRFGNYFYFYFLNNLHQQSIGFLNCLLFINNFEVSLVASYIFICFQQLFTGYMYNPFKIKSSEIIKYVSELLSFRTAPNGLMYSIFGIDRCDSEVQFSTALDDFGVIIDNVYSDSFYLILLCILFRFITFMLMIFRFSNLVFRKKNFIKSSKSNSIKKINYNDFTNSNELFIDLSKITINKQKEEIDFEAFTQHKIIVAWRSLSLFSTKSIYEIRTIKNEKSNSRKILKNLNGHFRFGTLNALMGPSGAGKTSLLNILIGKSKTRLSQETTFYLSKYTPIRICYLTQEVSGHLMPGLTAKQSLIYASKLKNVSEINIDHEAIAMKILQELDLVDTKDTYVENCSGGQRKRLALALELTSVRMPNLICIDEPTSGLDSSSAQMVISCLKLVAHHHNICIITSIHQPTADVLTMFDQVYVLAKGGVCVYSGAPRDIGQHLTAVSNETNQNNVFPVEELIKYSCLSYENSSVQELVRLANEKILIDDKILHNETINVIDGIPTTRNRFRLSSVWILSLRYVSYIRGYLWKILSLMYLIYVGWACSLYLIFGLNVKYFDGCISLEDDFNNTCTQVIEDENFHLLTSFIYSCFIFGMGFFFLLLQASLMFSKEIVYFSNEHLNGWYSTGAFYAMKIMTEIVPLLPALILYIYIVDIFELVYPGIIYWMFFFNIVCALCAQAIGHLIAILTSGKFMSLVITIPAVQILSIMVSNNTTPIRRLHYIYQFISIFSPTRFIIEGFLLLQYGFDHCKQKEVHKLLFKFQMDNDEHGHHYEFFYEAIIYLVMNLILYHIIALFILLIRTNRFENRRKRALRIVDTYEKFKPLNVFIPGLQCDNDFTIKQIQSNYKI